MESRLTKVQTAYENAVENVSDLHVKISEGNSKLGAIPSVSLIPVMDCGNCAICAKSCYDLRNDLIYKEVIKTRAINSAIYHEDPERYFKEIDGYLDYRYPRAFRFHIGGDIQDKWYLDKMCEIARKHKDTKFLAFTKMFDVCNEYLDEGNVSPGRHVTLHRQLYGVPEGRQTMLVHRRGSGGRIPCTLVKSPLRRVLCLTI